MAILVTPEGRVSAAMPEGGKGFTLEEMYKLLNCRTVDIRSGAFGHIIVDDEGLADEAAPTNPLGTALYMTLVQNAWLSDRGIVGNLLLCKLDEVE